MSFGIECYLNLEQKGFTGEIKLNCQDFVVTEIDKEGKMMELNSFDIPPPTMHPDQKHPTENTHGRCLQDSKKMKENDSVSSKTLLQPKISASFKESALAELSKILGSTKLKELTDFSTYVKSTKDCSRKLCLVSEASGPNHGHYIQKSQLTEPSCSQECNPWSSLMLAVPGILSKCFSYPFLVTPSAPITTGAKASKESRAAVHMNVRLAFPHLKTETVKSKGQQGEAPLIYSCSDPVYWELFDLLTDRGEVDRLICFAHWEDKNIPTTLDIAVPADKEQRTKIHRLLSKHFGSFLESKTFSNSRKISGNTQSCIQVRMRAKRAQLHNKPNPARQITDQYTGFVLCKRNMETLEAIQRLSCSLNIQPSAFSYAGIKDKNAVTKQYMVVRGVSPEQLHAIQGHTSLEGIQVSNYRRGVSPLRMGELRGNHFVIVIRNVKFHQNDSAEDNIDKCQQHIEGAVANLSTNGFINYFGPQRFGLNDNEVNACDIGLAMLRGDMILAVKLLLTPTEQGRNDPVNAAKRYYCETGDIQGCLDRMPRYKVRETLVLKALHRHGTDMEGCCKALLNIPYSMRLLFVHSYCSLVWNVMASYRMKQYNRSVPVEGDLICDKTFSLHGQYCEDRVTSGNTGSVEEQTPQHDNETVDVTTSIHGVRDHVRCVSCTNVTKYTLKDVVLPLPGYNVQYPANAVGERYKERLQADGLTVESFRLRGLGINVPGAYRKLIATPAELSWSWHLNEHAHVGNQESAVGGTAGDAKRLKLSSDEGSDGSDSLKLSLSPPAKEASENSIRSEMKREPRNSIYNNLKICFNLEPSCYATVCLRELMKT